MQNINYQSKWISTPEGLKLHLREGGIGPVTCIFIHGTAEGSYAWDDFANDIAPFFRVLLIDLRGHGASDWHPDGRYHIDDYVADAEIILNSLSLEKCVLVGHSLGGSIAMRIAARCPDRVYKLVLVDSGPVADPEVIRYLQEQLIAGYRLYDSVSDYVNWLKERRALPSSAMLEKTARESLSPTPNGKYRFKFDIRVVAALENPNDEAEWWSIMEILIQPTLIIRGATSALLSKSIAKKMAEQISRATVATVALAGHAIMSDNPMGFAAAIKPFLFKNVTE